MRKSQTAVVHASYAAPLSTLPLFNDLVIFAVDEEGSGSGVGVTTELPLRRTEHLFSDDGSVRWTHELWLHDENYEQSMYFGSVPRSFELGRSQRARWNRGVFSAALDEDSAVPAAVRTGDFIELNPAMSDGEGHAGFVAGVGGIVLYRDGTPIGESEWSSGFFRGAARDQRLPRGARGFTEHVRTFDPAAHRVGFRVLSRRRRRTCQPGR